ncbi:MAG: phosphonate ABC transporter substrate-binding protein [Desulfobacterales bacterium]|jgi:phosphonate transport system substrate-binding protein
MIRSILKTLYGVMFISLISAFCASVAIAAQEKKAEDYTELVFGIIPTDSLDTLKKGFEPFVADMSKKLGIKVIPRYATDYAGIIEAMRFKKVDFAWFGNKSAIEATNRSNAEVFAQTTDVDGTPGYWSVVIVHKDSPHKTIDDIIENGSKLSFGNGDPNSTSGFLVPTYYIWSKRGIDPNKHFKEVRNANHEANNMAVAQKQVDFATNNTMAQKRFQKNHPQMAQNIRVIWQSPLIPRDPICWRKDLPDEIKAKLKALFMGYGRIGLDVENEKKILAAISSGWGTFKNSDNRQLIPIRQINLVKDRRKIENNDDLSDEEKQNRIAEIDARLEELKNYFTLVQKF